MKTWYLFLMVFLLFGCSTIALSQGNQISRLEIVSELPDLGEAPELINEIWLNADYPLRLVDLRGKVVLLEMWTFG